MAKPDYSLLQSVTDPKAKAALRRIVEKIAGMETNVEAAQATIKTLPTATLTVAQIQALISGRLGSLGLLDAPAFPKPGVGSTLPSPSGTGGGGGTTPPSPPGPSPSPGGDTSGDNHVYTDAGGNFLGFGASVMWAFWGFQNDRERLSQNLTYLQNRGCQYIRVFGVVGGGTWADRAADPTQASYPAMIGTFTDWVYDNFGMRVHWTIFAGSPYTPLAADRQNVVDMFIAMVAGREDKIFVIEVANEAWQNDFPGASGLTELRNLAARLKTGIGTSLVAITSSQDAVWSGGYGAQDIYQGTAADVVTWHPDRTFSATGRCMAEWRPVRQCWGEIDAPGVPALHMIDEPIEVGFRTGSNYDNDPVRSASAAAVSYIGGVDAYTLHNGAGVRGGGASDLAIGRLANFFDYNGSGGNANLDTVMAAHRHVRDLCPNDVSNWHHFNNNSSFPERPFDVYPVGAYDPPLNLLCRIYGALSGNNFVEIAFGINGPCGVTCLAPAGHTTGLSTVTFYDVLTGAASLTLSMSPGQTVAFPAGPTAFIIKGTWN